MSVSFLKRAGHPDLAYDFQDGTAALPVIVFFPGYKSDMNGTKAAFLAQHAAVKGQRCLRFDYSGHGQSAGRFEDGTIGTWRDDALAVIDSVVEGPMLFIGSSMGGWIALLAALARPERIAGFIGIAAASDFTRDILRRMSTAQHESLRRDGAFRVDTHGPEPLIITQAFLDDGETHCLLDREIAIDCPVRLLQGKQDAEVPWAWANRIVERLRTKDKEVIFREEGDHRLSTPDDLALLAEQVDALSGR